MPSLLRSLATLLRLKGRSVSARSLMAGLAGEGRVTPAACLRAAEKVGLRGRILYRETLDNISPLTLPCALLLRHDRSCVLLSLRSDRAEVIFPEDGEAIRVVSAEDLGKEYSGYALFASPEAAPDRRAEALRLSRGPRWFWDVFRHYAPIYRHVAFASVIINLIAVLSPLFVMNVYDRVVPNNAVETLWALAAGILIAYLFDFILRYLHGRFVDMAGRNADVVLSSMLVGKVLAMRMDDKPESTGGLVNNLREFESLREFFSSSTLLACIDLPFMFLFLLLVAFIAGPVVVLPLLAIPLLAGLGLFLQARSKRAVEQNYKQNMQKNALLVEMVNGLETIKACMAESRMQTRWEQVSDASARQAAISRKYNNLAVTSFMLVTHAVTVGMVIWGVYRIGAGEMTMGALVGANILTGRAMAPLMQMASLLSRLQNSRVSLKALDIIMNLRDEQEEKSGGMDFGSLSPSLAMENVSFTYPGAQRASLNGVSLRIRPGERVGVIGRMGSGKSTLGKLLIGLYQPAEGAVKFGGVDIRQMPEADLRGRIGVLPQEVVLFYGSIRDNITLGDPAINDHLVLRAASLAGAAGFIGQNPAGFGAQVGEQGRCLSGGQRQAVALARALVRDPDVLILDEPTSNMDSDSERMILAGLKAACPGRTLVLITHRMSLLAIVDRLIVMDGGRIALDGPRDDVLARLKERAAARGGTRGGTAKETVYGEGRP